MKPNLPEKPYITLKVSNSLITIMIFVVIL